MTRRSTAQTILLATLGLLVAVVLGLVTTNVTNPSVGLSGQEASVSEELVVQRDAARDRELERRRARQERRKRREQRREREGAGGATTTDAAPSPSPAESGDGDGAQELVPPSEGDDEGSEDPERDGDSDD